MKLKNKVLSLVCALTLLVALMPATKVMADGPLSVDEAYSDVYSNFVGSYLDEQGAAKVVVAADGTITVDGTIATGFTQVTVYDNAYYYIDDVSVGSDTYQLAFFNANLPVPTCNSVAIKDNSTHVELAEYHLAGVNWVRPGHPKILTTADALAMTTGVYKDAAGNTKIEITATQLLIDGVDMTSSITSSEWGYSMGDWYEYATIQLSNGKDLDFSRFLNGSPRHASVACYDFEDYYSENLPAFVSQELVADTLTKTALVGNYYHSGLGAAYQLSIDASGNYVVTQNGVAETVRITEAFKMNHVGDSVWYLFIEYLDSSNTKHSLDIEGASYAVTEVYVDTVLFTKNANFTPTVPSKPTTTNTPITNTVSTTKPISQITLSDGSKVAFNAADSVKVDCKLVSEASIPAADKNGINSKIKNGEVVGAYLDINAYVNTVGGQQIKEMNGKIRVEFELPANLRALTGVGGFYIIRVHGTEVSRIPMYQVGDNGTKYYFETDRFSTYAIVYSAKDSVPKTGETSPLGVYAAVLLVAVLGMGLVSRKRRNF